MSKKFQFIVVLILIYFAYFYNVDFSQENTVQDYSFEIEEKPAKVTNFFVYGTHLNLEGKIKLEEEFDNLILGLVNEENEIKKYDLNYQEKEKEVKFYLSEKINRGIDLEKVTEGFYTFFLIVEGEVELYYLLKNKTEHENIEYYSLSQNGYTNKMYLNVADGFVLQVEKIAVPDDVYDFVLDPGHGGRDPGAVSGGYYERDLNLLYAKKIKEKLINLGYRVKLTRENNTDILPTYGPDGRVQFAYTTKAKFFFSIHFNSNYVRNEYEGVEIYVPPKTNLDFASELATNIKEKANTKYSNLEDFRVKDGVYRRFLSQENIDAMSDSFSQLGVQLHENMHQKTPYYFVLRETGGMMTNAYVDGRDPRREANEFHNSYIAPESYLVEFGYMNHDGNLANILNNKEGYVAGFIKTIVDNLER